MCWYGTYRRCLRASVSYYPMPVTTQKKNRAGATPRVQVTEEAKLRFGRGNAKLGRNVFTLSLPAGHTCPGAEQCMARVNMRTNKLEDGPKQIFRCFAATLEVAFKGFRMNNRFNLKLLAACKRPSEVAAVILRSLPAKAQAVRVHVSGDFFSQTYFDGWMLAAQQRPQVKFYAYTKSLMVWHKWLEKHGELPRNFTLTASEGGKFDSKIRKDWITARVVFHPDEARKSRLPIDHNDSHAQKHKGSFALLLHGVQPIGTDAAKAIQFMKDEGIAYSYPGKRKKK